MRGQQVCRPDQMTIERIFARSLVILGGLFWMIAAFAGHFAYQDSGLAVAARFALYPLAASIAILIVGSVNERLAAVLLFGGAAGVLTWGVLFGWEPFVWLIMAVVLIVPMLVSGTLFHLAGRMQEVCSMSGRYATDALAHDSSRT